VDPALEGYLHRLGYDAPPPATLATLGELHRAHLLTIPYENLGIMLGRPPSVGVAQTVNRIAATGRAGYCFHHNGALGALLAALGFSVTRWHGHVYDAEEWRWETSLNHLALAVEDLPTANNPGGRWWADVGLGDGFLDPLPLVAGDYRQHGFRYAVEAPSAAGWSFRHDPAGTFRGVEVSDRPLDLEAAHAELSLTPDSHFTRFLVAQRRDPTGVDTLRGCVLERVEPGRRDRVDVTSYDEWRGALTGVVGLPLDDLDPAELAGLWERTLAGHRAWDEAGRP
jgi:N-hydroxyarylamine O-acetyltransferase